MLVVTGSSRGTGALVASLARERGFAVRAGEHVGGADAVVLVPARGVASVAEQARAVIHAARVVLVSGFSVGHGLAHALNTPRRLRDLTAAEEIVRASGRPYTIVRPTWLTDDPPGSYALTLTRDPWADGMLPRADLARICLDALDEPAARGKTFAAFAEPGPPPPSLGPLFAAL